MTLILDYDMGFQNNSDGVRKSKHFSIIESGAILIKIHPFKDWELTEAKKVKPTRYPDARINVFF